MKHNGKTASETAKLVFPDLKKKKFLFKFILYKIVKHLIFFLKYCWWRRSIRKIFVKR